MAVIMMNCNGIIKSLIDQDKLLEMISADKIIAFEPVDHSKNITCALLFQRHLKSVENGRKNP